MFAAINSSSGGGDAEHVSLRVINNKGDEVWFNIKKTTVLKKLMDAYLQRQGLRPGAGHFLYRGTLVEPASTPLELGFANDDRIGISLAISSQSDLRTEFSEGDVMSEDSLHAQHLQHQSLPSTATATGNSSSSLPTQALGITLSMPEWASRELASLPRIFPHSEDRMREVIRFSALNIHYGTGGPFAAGVFETNTGRLVAMGVNRVVHSCCSSAHAEVRVSPLCAHA
jgi:hypothetical protein